MRNLTILVSIAFLPAARAQVEVDRSIRLEGTLPAERQVIGLDTLTLPGSVHTAHVEQAGAFRYDEPDPGPVWNVLLEGLNAAAAGTHIVLKVPEGGSGPVQIQVNGGGISPVEWEPGAAMDASALPAGFPLSLVFNGVAWQVMNGMNDRLRDCPSGTLAVNGQFCIEPVQRAAADFATAANACASVSRRLCTWGEFIAGCQRRLWLGLQFPNGDWEWTGNSANEENSVRMVRLSNCSNSGTRDMATPPAPYRCCITR